MEICEKNTCDFNQIELNVGICIWLKVIQKSFSFHWVCCMIITKVTRDTQQHNNSMYFVPGKSWTRD